MAAQPLGNAVVCSDATHSTKFTVSTFMAIGTKKKSKGGNEEGSRAFFALWITLL
jgi:hypothetical protein